MATETVIPDHTTTDEVEKLVVNDEVKTDPQEIAIPSKKTEEENPKAEASSGPQAPCQSEEKQDAEAILLASLIKEIKSVEQETLSSVKGNEEVKAIEQQTVSPSMETEEENPKAAESCNVEDPSPEAEDGVVDKQIEPSPEPETLSSVQETEEEKSEVEKIKAIEHETISPSQETEEGRLEAAESQSVEAPSPEAAEKKEDKQFEPSPEQETLSSVQETLSSVQESEEEKTEVEEVKAIEQETVAPSMETEEEKPKDAGLCSTEAPSPEAEEKHIEPSSIIKQVALSSVEETEEEISIVEELKAIEQETISPYKETEEEKPTAAELQSPEIEEKMEDKQIEPSPVIKEVEKTEEEEEPKAGALPSPKAPLKTIEQESISPSKETEEEEEPKAGALPSPKAPSPELEEKMVDEQIEPPPEIKEVEKIGDAPPSTEEVKPEAVSPWEETEEEEKSKAEKVRTVEKEIISPYQETQEEKPKDAEQIPEAPLSKSEGKMVGMQTETSSIIGEVEIAADTPVLYAPAEDKSTIAKEPEAIVEETEDSGSGKPLEEPEATEKVCRESDINPEESKKIEIAKEKETLADIEPEDTILLKEKQNKKDQEPFPSGTADQLVLTDREGNGGESSLPCVSEEKEVKESENFEEGEVKDVKTEYEKEENVITEESIQPETLTVENVGSSISNSEVTGKLFEGENLNPEEDSKDNVIPETSTQPKTNTLEDASSPLATTEVTEKLFEGENTTTTRDFEQFLAYKKEEALPSVQTDKDKEKLHEVTTADIFQKARESPEAEMEVKGEGQEAELELKEKGNTDELEKEREVNVAARSDESPKDKFHEKASPDQPKQQEVSTKPTQKQSNTIMSKVKQSLAKAKKAITGKSSKSTQRDIKVSSV